MELFLLTIFFLSASSLTLVVYSIVFHPIITGLLASRTENDRKHI